MSNLPTTNLPETCDTHAWCDAGYHDTDPPAPPTEHYGELCRWRLWTTGPEPWTGEATDLEVHLSRVGSGATRAQLVLASDYSKHTCAVGRLDVAQCRELARVLLKAAATIEAERPLVCLDCGDEFAMDSTPDLDRCWSCAERADHEDGDR